MVNLDRLAIPDQLVTKKAAALVAGEDLLADRLPSTSA